VPAAEFDLLVIGDCNPDLILRGDAEPQFGQVERIVEAAELTVGGSAAIVACGAARLGLRTALAAVVGDDVFGRFMLAELRRRNVDVDAVLVRPTAATGVTTILAREGDRAILTFPGTSAALRASDLSPALLHRARHVHVASLYLQPWLAAELEQLLADARAGGARTSLDPNWDPAEEWNGGLAAAFAQVDFFLPNAAEACAIAGEPDVEAAARALALRGPTVVVKRGAAAALAVDASGMTTCVPPTVAAVDSTGAGDSFDAGLIRGLLDGLPVASALELACACGALSTRSTGGVNAQPTLDEALRLTQAPATQDPGSPPDRAGP